MEQIAKIEVFGFEGAEVRTVIVDGNPWFAAADVGRVLTLVDVGSSIREFDEDEKGVQRMQTPGGLQSVAVLSEAGLYRLMMRTDKFTDPKVGALIKRFRKWVTGEVLPTLRKTGAYAVPGLQDWSIPKTMPEALRLAATALEALEEARPKVEFYNAVVADDSWFTLQRAAGVLNIPGLGRTNLFRFLREEEIFTPGNIPYRRFIEEGYFRLQDVRTPVGVKSQPMVSQKGIDFILKRWNKARAAEVSA